MRSSSGVRWSPIWPSSVITAASRILIFWLLIEVISAQTLPYIPTTILVPVLDQGSSQNITSDTAYVFYPNNGTVDLLALNFSKTVEASSSSLQTLSSDLPFLTSNNTAFSPTTADNGSLIVYAGDCLSSDSASIWTLDALKNGIKSTWSQEITTSSSGSSQIGPAFLGGSLGYSSTLAPTVSQAVIYVYGGMCANSTSDDETSSQSSGEYTNRMIKLTPSGSAYSIETITKNTLVAEAGFTFTELPPSFSSVSGVVSQQVQHILLGGHTQLAFVNFSTAAIWSLPEESWTSVEITKAESTTKSTEQDIDPRSGHTTILNEAGNQLIVLGGWVGDPSTAANPQLLVLEVAAGYGGNGSWQWSIPDEQPSNAIYGHGAALLPGNVMMIYGGHALNTSASKRLKRATSLSSTTPMFLNLTSMSWSDAYTNPAHLAAGGSAASGSGTKAKQRLGLGLGLGFGLAAVLGAVLVYFCYRWRSRHEDEMAREKAIDALVQNNNHYVHEDEGMLERNDAQHFPWYTDRLDPFMSSPRFSRYESLRTQPEAVDEGDLGGVRPLNITRKPVPPRAAKGQYQPAPLGIYDPPRATRAGPIHPIHEEDEDVESRPHTAGKDSNRDSAAYSDPFQTPTHEKVVSFPPPSRASLTPSPEAQRRHTDPEVRDWMCDVDAADALLTSHMARSPSKAGGGRISPTRRKSNRSGYIADDDSRTDSNLSESARSHFSRSGSNRSHARSAFGIGTSAAAAAATAEDRQGTSSSSNSSAPTYNTARSSFNVLQAEGPSLLRGRKEGDHDDYDPPPSPSKTKPRRNWLGSLRRVFSGPTPSPSTTDSDREPVRDDSTAEASDYDPRLGGLGGIAAGGLLRRKGGRGAWEAIQQSSGGSPSHPHYPAEGPYDNDDDEEWDIEKAVERRLVQVMFTVPKERLRVVNGEPDVESMQDVEIVDPNRDVEDEIREELDKLERYASASASARSREAAAAAAAAETGDGTRRDDEGERNYTWTTESELDREGSRRDKGKQRAKTPISDSGLGTEISSTTPASPLPPPMAPHHYPPHLSPRLDDDTIMLSPPPSRHSHMTTGRESLDSRRHQSMTSDMSEGFIMNAEAVRYERPRTKVRQMIDTIESRSQSASPDRMS